MFNCFKRDKKKHPLTIADCNCRVNRNYKLILCDFHKECIGDSCAPGINVCSNPEHRKQNNL